MPGAPDSPYGALTPHQRQLVLRLLGGGAPIIIARLAAWCLLAGLVDIGSLTAAELFAGQRAITLGLRYYGVSCFAYELKDDPSMGTTDILSDIGFAFALSLCLSLQPGAVVWIGIVCSTWVWMSRGSTGRCEAFPMGPSMPSQNVRDGNAMCARVMLLCYVIDAIGCIFVIEQPGTSILALANRFRQLMRDITIYTTRLCLGHFMANTLKPILLYSNHQFICELPTYALRNWAPSSDGVTTVAYITDAGDRRVDGAKALKDTQAYPMQFGEAFARLYTRYHAHFVQAALARNRGIAALDLDVDAFARLPNDDGWIDAGLGPSFRILRSMAAMRECANRYSE